MQRVEDIARNAALALDPVAVAVQQRNKLTSPADQLGRSLLPFGGARFVRRAIEHRVTLAHMAIKLTHRLDTCHAESFGTCSSCPPQGACNGRAGRRRRRSPQSALSLAISEGWAGPHVAKLRRGQGTSRRRQGRRDRG